MKCFVLAVTLQAIGWSTTISTAQSVEDCIDISCRTYNEINTLWCHALPTHFCQCRPSPVGLWVPQVMPCAEGTVYSFRHQVCVHPDMRNDNDCSNRFPDELDLELCAEPPVPSCETYEEINELSCHQEPKRFCQCRPLKINPTEYAPLAMPCAGVTTFSFQRQTCVHDGMWEDSCPKD
ncbi:uncharacterized protein LOC131686768 [Topomyia yanbarensis]|uniref:uncharacterized protein LOC131686768 n=1 Tax=Topomyia yanbarensis TaxID=2498891 RepID=UPI00273BDB5E|nr:uncharacterized protein LOC131686768 [Topomyia yanbarensis]